MHTILQGESTFAFDRVIKRTRKYLERTHQLHQIKCLPMTYPQHYSEISQMDIIPRGKILKCHLEDTFSTCRFSVKITRKKFSSVIKITHDSIRQDKIAEIAELYIKSENLVFERFTNV